MSIFAIISESPGFKTIAMLSLLTLLEYIVFTADITGAVALLMVIALIKAAIIVISFMHVKNIFGEETS